MLSKGYRLTTASFKKVFEKGSVSHTEHFSLRILKDSSVAIGHPQFSAVVSKKIGATAVIRNRHRRRIYTALAPLITKTAKPAQIGVFLKKDITQCTIDQIRRELKEVLEKTGVVA